MATLEGYSLTILQIKNKVLYKKYKINYIHYITCKRQNLVSLVHSKY